MSEERIQGWVIILFVMVVLIYIAASIRSCVVGQSKCNVVKACYMESGRDCRELQVKLCPEEER